MLGKRLRHIRMKRGYTQQFTADNAQIALRTLQGYEQGSRSPSYDVLVILADFFDVSVDWLLGRDEWLTSHAVSFDEYL